LFEPDLTFRLSFRTAADKLLLLLRRMSSFCSPQDFQMRCAYPPFLCSEKFPGFRPPFQVTRRAVSLNFLILAGLQAFVHRSEGLQEDLTSKKSIHLTANLHLLPPPSPFPPECSFFTSLSRAGGDSNLSRSSFPRFFFNVFPFKVKGRLRWPIIERSLPPF